ncbi:sigma-70 family RNA polymerase sigma factor [Nocardia sp. NRRL S-836]|uniref:sigma-70 family RNA polymerase sigma factor n=1 Tax=Nocardia sp. NRRL S-836 TaxID=1519492 RepID=UPI0006AFC0C2|nr:sigma-70 family RNA polymerase sigma factor [Nocardia sp. NRRL S-836]KOV88932.1 ECF subfamily RNA polymerase sigma-24 subunit [Nocardia sp. NRRL S-836]
MLSHVMVDENEVDRDLLARVRDGDDSAYGELFSRHADAVRRFSLRHVREAAEADDLTAESFFRMLQAIRRGSGPTDHVRTYLLTVARRVAWEWSGRRRDVPVDDEELSRRTEPVADNAARRAEHNLITRAFSSLPERWRVVLWRVEVEGERPASVAPHFGLSPNAMSALARRAREGLRAAYLQAHLAVDDGRSSCAAIRAKLGTFTAGGVQGVEERRIRAHLDTCSSCSQLHAELNEVCATLRANAAFLVVPSTLGLAFAGKVLLGKAKLAVAAASIATIGLVGTVATVFSDGPGTALLQPDQNPVVQSLPSGTTSGHSQELVQVPPAPQQHQPQQHRENVVVPVGNRPAGETVRRTSSAPPPATEQRREPATERAEPVGKSSGPATSEVETTTESTPRGVKSLDTPSSSQPPSTSSTSCYPPPAPPTTSTTITLYPKPRTD